MNPERRRRVVESVRRHLRPDQVSERLVESYPRFGSERMHQLLLQTGLRVSRQITTRFAHIDWYKNREGLIWRRLMKLRTNPHLSQAFNVPVGLSDHTMDLAVPVAAVLNAFNRGWRMIGLLSDKCKRFCHFHMWC